MKVRFGGKTFVGKAASTDLNLAAARAYLHAVNKALWEKERFASSEQQVATGP